MASNSIIETVNQTNFTKSTAQGVVLVDFYADWCGPCKMLTPILEQVAQDLQGQATIVKVDTDESSDIAAQYEVSSIPTLILFKNGQKFDHLVGLKDAATIKQLIQKAL